jgi:neutral ceramidase
MVRSLVAVWLVTVMVAISPGAEPGAWKAGAAMVKITPATSLRMAGYAARKKPSEGVAQDLWAKALAVEDAHGTRAVIVTLDLIGMSRALRDWFEGEVQRRYGLPRAGLLMNASHTHCGPSLRAPWVPAPEQPNAGPQTPADQYMVQLQQRLVAVVGDALKRLAPARLDFLHARAGFAMNRRLPTDAGFRNAPSPDSPVDHEVPVLRVCDPQGKLVAVLFGYACHNTTMGDYLFRGDYAGYAQQYFQEDHPGTVALFMAGCGADQNPYPRSKEELVRYHGRTLATAVEAALLTVPRPIGGPLCAALEDVTLDFTPPPSRAELEQLAATAKAPQRSQAQRLLRQLQEEGKLRTSYNYPVQVLRFGGDLTLVALAGEVVVDYSLRLKRELAGPAVWVAGYSNDVLGYVPSLRVLTEGGYEAGRGIAYGKLLGGFAPSIEERIVAKARQLAGAPRAVAN